MLDTPASSNFDHTFNQIAFGSRTALIVAVSGGSDSTALLVALRQWARRNRLSLRMTCCTVDHGLRTGSAQEAEQVAVLCSRLGIEHRTRLWTGDKPSTGLASAARSARYGLLAETARVAGTDMVVTGHTADDQAETVCMRAARGGDRGMAGMAAAALFDRSVWIVRPFLDMRRRDLRSYLQSCNVAWIDDPTNEDLRYERTRVRRELDQGDQTDQLLAIANNAARDRREASAQSASLIDRHATLVAPGLVRLERAIAQEDDINVDALRFLLACCGGSPRPASRKDTRRFLVRLKTGRACLSGAIVTAAMEAIYIHRERRNDRPHQVCGRVFDGRYSLSDGDYKSGWRLQRRTGADDWEPDVTFDRPVERLARAAWRAEPQLIHSVLPTQTPRTSPAIRRYLAPFDHFLPDFDLTLANAMAQLFGCEQYPSSPVKR